MTSIATIYDSVANNLATMVPTIASSFEEILPASFYTDLPAVHPAYFSTNMGKKPFGVALDPAPPVIARSDIISEVQRMATKLRNDLPAVANKLTPVSNWADLYYYFDAHDLQVEGPAFLYYVVEHLVNENAAENAANELSFAKRINQEIFNWAGEWVHANIDRIRDVPITADLITTVFTADDHKSISSVDASSNGILRGHLRYHHSVLKARLESDAVTKAAAAENRRMHHLQTQQPSPMLVQRQVQQLRQQEYPNHAQQMAHGPRFGPQGSPVMSPPQMHVAQPYRPPGRSISTPTPNQTMQYTQFMESQRQNNRQWQQPNRPRTYSNERFMNERGGRGNFRNNFQNRGPMSDRHLTYNNNNNNNQNYQNSGPSPQKAEPVFVPKRLTPTLEEQNSHDQPSKLPPVGRNGFSNDGRVIRGSPTVDKDLYPSPFGSDPQATMWHTGLCTYFYNNDLCAIDRSRRSLYIGGSGLDTFTSHELKDVVSQFGEVDYISFRVPTDGPAFVVFKDESSVDKAVNSLRDFQLSNGQQINVSHSFPQHRESISSSYSYHRNHQHSRQSSQSYQRQWSPESNAPPPLTVNFEAQPPPSLSISQNTKENSPLKTKKGKKKGSKQNTSARPTPATSPNRSTISLKALADITNYAGTPDHGDAALQSVLGDDVTEKMTSLSDPGKPTKFQRKRKTYRKPEELEETPEAEKPSFAAVACGGAGKVPSRAPTPKSSFPIVPAVPLTMERRRLSCLDTDIWPIVKACVPR